MGAEVAPPLLAHPAIVLAAGRSSRMPVPKGLVEVRGRPWLEHQLDALRDAGVLRVVVVLGFAREAYERALPHMRERAAVAINEAPERGPFSSLQCGISELAGDAAYVLPVDVPCAGASVWRALA